MPLRALVTFKRTALAIRLAPFSKSPVRMSPTPRPKSATMAIPLLKVLTKASTHEPIALNPSPIPFIIAKIGNVIILMPVPITFASTLKASEPLYILPNHTSTSRIFKMTLFNATFHSVSARVLIVSQPFSCTPNIVALVYSRSAVALRLSSNACPYSPVCFLISSKLVLIVSSPSIISWAANFPCRPNTALITSPTSCALSGICFKWRATSCRLSNIDI